MDGVDIGPYLLAAAVGAAGFIFSEMRRPGQKASQTQEKLVWLAIAAGGAYMLRQFEGRGDQQEKFAVAMAAMDSKNEERFRTAFNDIHDIKTTLRDLAERWLEQGPPRSTRKRR